MLKDPLKKPGPGSLLSKAFLQHFHIEQREPGPEFLETITRAFGSIPYENLTKIIKLQAQGLAERARRNPEEVFKDHTFFKTGGTCFSLTALLLHLVRSYGYEAEPVLADRRYGPNTHCALLVTLEGKKHLIDPGFLIFKPTALEDDSEKHIQTPFNEVILRPGGNNRLALSTKQNNSEAYRLTFKLPGADPSEFMRAWHESFAWDMMRYPILTRIVNNKQKYLQKMDYKERDLEKTERNHFTSKNLVMEISNHFGIVPKIAAQAVEIIQRKENLFD